MNAVAQSARTSFSVRPGSRLYLALIVPLVAAVLAPSQARLLLLLDLIVFVAFAIDALRLSRVRVLLTREAPTRLAISSEAQVKLIIDNQSGFSLRARVRDDAPNAIVRGDVLRDVVLAPMSQTLLHYDIKAQRRGLHRFGSSYVRIEGRLGLCAVDFAFEDPQDIRVTPRRVLSHGPLKAGPRDEIGDVRKRLLRAPQSSSGELESLREYVAGDPLRTIDWKATAKRERPVTRVYQPERSQTLWLVLDASRTMVSTIGERDGVELTRFDVACQTALALSEVALRAGDQVGLVLFGDACLRLVLSGRGRAHQRLLADALSEADAGLVPLDVRGLVTLLERQARKRGFLVLLTDLDNEIHGRALAEHAPLLTRRHLTLVVSLDDASVNALGQTRLLEDQDVYDKVAALSLLEERESLRAVLEKRGVHVIEANEQGIAQRTIDRYLEAKTRNRL